MSDASTAERCDFFVSYTAEDRTWAEWISWQLEAAGFTTLLQAWDFRPGGMFPSEMHEALRCAERTLAVLSPAYLASQYAASEWLAAFRDDPLGRHRKLVPVRIQECAPDGLLGSIVWIDLVGLDEQEACAALLAGVRRERAKPSTSPLFPSDAVQAARASHPERPFPTPEPSSGPGPAQRRRAFDRVDGSWAAFSLAGTTWIVEAQGADLHFRRFGDHTRSRAAPLDGPIEAIAIAPNGLTVATQVGRNVQLAAMNGRGQLAPWIPSTLDEGRPPRLVALGDDPADGTTELLMTSNAATFSFAPRDGRLEQRRQVCAVPARCAACVEDAFLIVSPAGRVIRGTAPLDARDGWVDIDAAAGAGVELLAAIRDDGDARVLLAVSRDARGSELRQVAVDSASERVRVARTPSRREPPAQIVVEVGGELTMWSWDELPDGSATP